jgi:hypothetical protein
MRYRDREFDSAKLTYGKSNVEIGMTTIDFCVLRERKEIKHKKQNKTRKKISTYICITRYGRFAAGF